MIFVKRIRNNPKANAVFDNFTLFLKLAFVAGLSVLLLRGFLLIPVEVLGDSMENTLAPQDMLIMSKVSPVNRFDVVVLELEDHETLVKRVIGLPGDSLKFEEGKLFINDKLVPEPFLDENLEDYDSAAPFTNDFTLEMVIGKTHLGEGEYFVMGDNRPHSRDSRSFGLVTEEQILGRALMVYYPFSDLQILGGR